MLALHALFAASTAAFLSTTALPQQHARRLACRAASPVTMEAAPPPMEINWVPPINPSEGDSEPSDGATVMPLFPLGVTYLPFTQNTLNIFEPRYRQMYNDILFSGARRFMVCNVDQETGRLAETGVIFYLDELKEVSEQTQDRVKYIGQHSVKGRVQLKKVLNPSVAATRETYLKAEVVELVDTDADESTESEEAGLRELFSDLVDVQASSARSRALPRRQGGGRVWRGSGSEDKGLWGTVVLWQQFLEQRASVVGSKMQREIQKEVVSYLKNNEIDSGKVNSRGEMRMEDLPADLRQEIQTIQEGATGRSSRRWRPTRTACSSRRCCRRTRTSSAWPSSGTSSTPSASGSPRGRRCSRCLRWTERERCGQNFTRARPRGGKLNLKFS